MAMTLSLVASELPLPGTIATTSLAVLLRDGSTWRATVR
jgi:hypothetical protein